MVWNGWINSVCVCTTNARLFSKSSVIAYSFAWYITNRNLRSRIEISFGKCWEHIWNQIMLKKVLFFVDLSISNSITVECVFLHEIPIETNENIKRNHRTFLPVLTNVLNSFLFIFLTRVPWTTLILIAIVKPCQSLSNTN